MRYNPFQVVDDFECAIAEYCGAPYAVATTSCTTAIYMALMWFKRSYPSRAIIIPARTYIGVPMSIKNAGFKPCFRHKEWSGKYRLSPLPLWDSARRLTSGMFVDISRHRYKAGKIQCLSLHWSKILGVQQGGVLLTDSVEARDWLRRFGFDGRTRGVPIALDTFDLIGIHSYMSPETAAAALMRLSLLPEHNEDLPNDNYPDLSLMEIFK